MKKNLEFYLNWAVTEFTKADLYFGHGTDNPWDEAVHVAIYALNLPKDNPRSVLKLLPNTEQAKLFKDIVHERVKTRKPLPYIIGYCWYAHEKYLVNEHTIVPRSPIFSFLMDKLQPWLKITPKKILDMCTGSGCLAIVAGKQFPNAQVIGVDISQDALKVAKQNIALHKMTNVSLVHSNLFSNLKDIKFDTIITNPPYVSNKEMQTLPQEYLHEPNLALESKDNGLAITKEILAKSVDYLNEGGILILEVGNSYKDLEKIDPTIARFAIVSEIGGHGLYVFSKEDLRNINARTNKHL